MLDPSAVSTLETPVGFIMGVLRQPLYDWQAEFTSWCEDIHGRNKLSMVAPNGSGKSAVIIAGITLWWLGVHKRGRVVITTKDSKQLDNQIEPALRTHTGKLDGWKFIERRVENGTGGFAVLFTTDDAGRAEGWHQAFLEDGTPDPESPLLIIVDEAKSVDPKIFEAIDRCTYNVLIYVSSPGLKQGRFYESQESDKGFKAMKIGLAQCPHIPKARIDDIIRTYGADHPFTRSTLYGEFMDEDQETMFIIPPSAVRALLEDPLEVADGAQYAFCDFAAGGDECVFAHKRGNKIELVCWKEPNTMATIGRFIMEFVKRGLRASDIYGDESGLGGPIIDRMAETGWPINRVNNGAAALNPDRYENRGAEMWHMAGIQIQNRTLILPQDQKLQAQLTTRKMKPLSDGRIGAESKKDMAKRGLTSPDRADAVVGVLAIEAEIAASAFDADGLKHLEGSIKPPKLGTLATADFGVNWTDDATGWLQAWELPTFGRAYVACLKAGKLGWSVFVLRKACADEQGKPLPDAVVARIKPPCEWDAAFLAGRIDLVLRWYGGPVIVPDVRNGMDILERLKDQGASIYRRPVFDRTPNTSGQQFIYGWETTEKNVPVAISALSRAIRERSFVVPDAVAVNDFRGYTSTDLENGDTICLGIGLQCFDAAMVHTPPQFAIPPFNVSIDRTGSMMGGACK